MSKWKLKVKISEKVKMSEWKIEGHFMSLREKERDDTCQSSDLARIGELGRVDVRQHHRTQRKIVDEVGDPERCDHLMVLSTSERHLHHPIGVRDQIVASIHVVR